MAPASADSVAAPARTDVFRAQPARGPVPHAHTTTKVTKSDGPVSIVRDPTDLPPPLGKRGPQRVKVDLETVEMTGKLADWRQLPLLDLQPQGPGSFRPRARGRHRRGAAQEPRRQHADAQRGLPRRDRTGRRRQGDRRGTGRIARLRFHRHQSRALRLPLRGADGGAAHRQRHVRPDPGRAGGRTAQGRSRVLRDAGRDLHRAEDRREGRAAPRATRSS